MKGTSVAVSNSGGTGAIAVLSTGGRRAHVYNSGAKTVYIGGSDVDATHGFALLTLTSVLLDPKGTEMPYAMCGGTDTSTLLIAEYET